VATAARLALRWRGGTDDGAAFTAHLQAPTCVAMQQLSTGLSLFPYAK
jgi:hypothetical protein